MSTAETIKAIDDEIKRQEAELQRLREERAAIKKAEIPADDQELLLSVLSCPHTITHESITLRFNPKQDGYNALAQLHQRLAAATAHPAEGALAQTVELEVDDLIDRLLDAQQDLNLAANIHMDQSIASASTLLDEVEIALRALAATTEAAPENIREGSPYDNPAFEQLARDLGVWGTPQAALCAQFWLAAIRARTT